MDRFEKLLWYRLKADIVNTRLLPSSNAHPVSICEAIIKSISLDLQSIHQPTQQLIQPVAPLIVFHITCRRHTTAFHLSERLPLEILFFHANDEYVESWRERFIYYFKDGSGSKNFELIDVSPVETRAYKEVAADFDDLPDEGEICLEFLTPLPFKRQKDKSRTYLSTSGFIATLTNRFSKLFNADFTYPDGNNQLSVLPYYWAFSDRIKHPSHSQPGNMQLILGCFGMLYIKGIFRDILPYLILGSEVHAGVQLSNSCGYYILHKKSPSYFDRLFPNKKVLINIIKDTIERYDTILEIPENDGCFNEEDYADNIIKEIVTENYQPSPNTAFHIKKKDSLDRIVEQLNFKDMVIQQYLFKTCRDIFELFFEECSIGFRRGISRQAAVEKVMSAIAGGCQYVVESDIEDFFPSIDIARLKELIERHLPEKDSCFKSVLFKSIQNGYILNGGLHERTRYSGPQK
jgi:CRISPR-associated protein Cas1